MDSNKELYAQIADRVMSLASNSEPSPKDLDELALQCVELRKRVDLYAQRNASAEAREAERLLHDASEVIGIQKSCIAGESTIEGKIALGEIVCRGYLWHPCEWDVAANIFNNLLLETDDSRVLAYLNYRLAEIRLGDTLCVMGGQRLKQAAKSVLKSRKYHEANRLIADDWLDYLETPHKYLEKAIALDAGEYSAKAKYRLATMYYYGDPLLKADKDKARILFEELLTSGALISVNRKRIRALLAEILQKPGASTFDLSRAIALYKEAIAEYEATDASGETEKKDVIVCKYNLARLLSKANLPEYSPHDAQLLYKEVINSGFTRVAAEAMCDQSAAHATGTLGLKKNKSKAMKIAKDVLELDEKTDSRLAQVKGRACYLLAILSVDRLMPKYSSAKKYIEESLSYGYTNALALKVRLEEKKRKDLGNLGQMLLENVVARL